MDMGNALATRGEFAAAREERDAAYRDVGDQRAFLDAILDSIPHPVFVKDRAHRLVTMNQAVADAWQLSKGEILGRRDEDLIPYATAMQAYEEDDRVLDEGVALTREMRFRIRTGTGDRALLIKQRVRSEAGRECLVGVAIPVGDPNAAQQRAEESERLRSAVLNAIPTPVVARDDALRWILVNDAYLAAVGADARHGAVPDGRGAPAGRRRSAFRRAGPPRTRDRATPVRRGTLRSRRRGAGLAHHVEAGGPDGRWSQPRGRGWHRHHRSQAGFHQASGR
jgi:PAS domain-containing protein